MNKVNIKLNTHIKNVSEKPLTPKEAFITFETEEAYNFILQQDTIEIFGHPT